MEETLLYNGTILTLDPANRAYAAVALRDGRIHALGASEEIGQAVGPGATRVDLAGRTVCPGFIDGHNHFSIAAFEPQWIDCSTPPLASVVEVLETIRRRGADATPNQWVRGWGFHASKVREQRAPTRWELDEVCPTAAFVLMDASCHACYVNSRALDLAGITRDSPDPRTGRIVKDDRGEPTGVLLEGASDIPTSLSWLAVVRRSPDDALALLEQHCRRHLAMGVTGVGDALVLPEAAQLYRRAAEQGRLALTVHQMHGGQTFFAHPDADSLDRAERLRGDGRMLRGGMLKMFMDTVYPSPDVDYCDHGVPDSRAESSYYSQNEAADLAVAAASHRLDVAIHCVGNHAVHQALGALAAVRAQQAGRHARLRIEHFNLGSREQVARTAELDIMVMMQPGFSHTWGDEYLAWRGEHGHVRILPLRSLLDAGAVVAASSDYPCGPLHPALGMWGAVARQTPAGEPVDPDEGVTPLEALRMYTSAAALACGREEEEGTIEIGKRGNLVVLDRNPLTCGTDAIRAMEVTATYVDGRRVFDRGRDGAAPWLAAPVLHDSPGA